MKSLLGAVVLLYVVALHVSMGGMEIFGWLSVVAAIVYKIQNKKSFETYGMLWPVVAFVAAGLLSLFVNPALKPFGPQAGFLRFGLLFFGLSWALTELWSKEFEKRLLTVWGAALSLMGAYGGLQMFTGIDFLHTDKVGRIGGVWKATSFFSNSLTFGYSIGISLVAYTTALFAKIVDRRLVYSALALGALGLISSTARGAWVAAFVCVLIFILSERKRLILPFVGVSAGALAILYFFASSFGPKIEKLANLELDHSSSVRFDLWPAYWQMFLDHPFFGVGLFQGDQLLPEYYAKLGIEQTFYSHAHNNFFQFLGGTGAVGFLAYCWLIAVPMARAWSIRKVSYWGWPLFLSQLFLQIGGLTECNFIDGEVNHMLMFTWALTMVIAARSKA